MPPWTDDELRRIDSSQELEIAPVRHHGGLRSRMPIWAVRAGDDPAAHAALKSPSGFSAFVFDAAWVSALTRS